MIHVKKVQRWRHFQSSSSLCDWLSVIIRDWISVIDYQWLIIHNWLCAIDYPWLIIHDWLCAIDYPWLIICDWLSMFKKVQRWRHLKSQGSLRAAHSGNLEQTLFCTSNLYIIVHYYDVFYFISYYPPYSLWQNLVITIKIAADSDLLHILIHTIHYRHGD